ncbi:MAG TPA: MogA/MoaB family molybdenum cofactor biosynthesis protein [Clostridiaceae bacterium]|nr:MogA/MoaB family molybdenum cofactor biosynthesis protein [Clostridiaceae bacterium]
MTGFDETRRFKACVLIVSDSRSIGATEERVGPLLRDLLEPMAEIIKIDVVPDNMASITRALISMSLNLGADLILTSGGTGFSPRDVTPEATMMVSTKMAPGFAEEMRRVSTSITPHGMLSRAVSVIYEKTLIINMPGSPKAVRECFDAISPALPHAIETLRGESGSEPEDHRHRFDKGIVPDR